ncbi:zf-C3Hc3H domain-containing lethal (3) L1231 isoform 1-T3 [Cochliomyia hominivorax]
MSCQQVTRLITNSNNLNLNHNNNNNNCNILNNNILQQQQQHNNTIKGNHNTRTIATGGGGGGLIVVQQQQQEDPYVFTESVPTSPILFNTQKTRTRLNDLPPGTTLSIGKLQQQQQQQQKLPLTETNGKITLNSLKTQASCMSSSASSITAPTTATANTCSIASTATSTFKNNVTQSLTTTTITTTNNNCNTNKKLTNICIVRPQLQQQQPQHYQHQNYINSSISSVYEGDLKSISPPPLYTPPTPSLWQTPLLLESSAPAGNTTSFQNNGVVMAKSQTTTSQTNIMTPSLRCATPTIQTSTAGLSSSNTSAAAAAVTTNQTSSMTTTAMAKVAPIIVHTPTLATATSPSPQQPSPTTPNQCLPPSKFHSHTLAQHLQKVECLKNSKKSLEIEENLTEKIQPSSPSTQKTAALKIATSPVKHSENEDLNEIPVNVIFRMAMVPQTNEKSSNNIQFVKPQTEIDIQTTKQIIIPPSPSLSSSSSTTTLTSSSASSSAQQQMKTNVNKKLSTIPASKIITTKLQQINTSSIQQQQPQQQKQNNATTTALNSQPNNNINNNEKDETNSKTTTKTTATTPTIKETLTRLNSNNSDVSITKIKNSTHISTIKTYHKLNLLNSSITTKVSKDLPADNWQIDGCTSTTKGAVAIVKMSQHNIDLDTTHLATAAGLPYCLQQYWLDANDYRKLSLLSTSSSSSSSSELLAMDKLLNRSLAREERIALYKQQLRRQAMQLLSTRSLQKLPIQIARRRLMCVDRLLRKYQQNEQNKREQPANVKRCCVNGCDAYTIELASHCQKHIVYNSAQHVFLPCTAKFADNTQCRVPVFDINHDLPLCMEHARKRDAYNRHLYEQRPRKISTIPMAINDTILTTTTTTTSTKVSNNRNMEGKVKGNTGIGGILIKTQNFQQQKQKQQQQQNILQQLPTNQYINSNNGNKRPTLVNQQQSRKRKMTNVITVAGGSGGDAGFNGNPVGRPQKRVKKNTEKTNNTKTNNTLTTTTTTQLPRLTTTNLKRKSSTTSLESIASNSQHSTASCTSQQQQQQQQQQQYQRQQPQQQHFYGNSSLITNTTTTSSSPSSLPPPALAPLSGSGLLGHGLPQHLFSFGHDNHHHNHHSQQYQQPTQQQQQLQPLNINDKHSFIPATATASSTTASTPTELKDFITQFSLLTQKQNNQQPTSDKMNDINLLNTNSNSNFTSSGMGSTTSLPTADDFLTQDMLSICENSSASSADTGLGGLSDPELMLGGTEDDIPLGDTHLLEEHDLENVLNSLPEDAFKELFTAVHQDESDEIERAIELADKHLKTLQQTIGSELGDFLDFNDDMLMDNGDLCNGSTANTILDTSALFIGGGGLVGAAATANGSIGVTTANPAQSAGSVIGTDIRGLVQT